MNPNVLATLTTAPLRELLRADIRLTDVFYRHKLDFCCGGHQTLAQAAERAHAPLERVLEDLENQLRFGSGKPLGAEKWPLHFLVEYIELIHHAYTRDALTTLAPAVAKVLQKHGRLHPELDTVAELFVALNEELQAHLQKEERILFPYIVRLEQAAAGQPFAPAPFGTVQNPIRMMEAEHDDAGRLLEQLAEVTGQFTPPADACNTYCFVYRRLQELDTDLRLHIHLENNILFPRALALELQLSA
ncbi:iron-sulfur cluster repair di-iron protein [Hymenobacter koreensis]|uniref:Iron-sulfur cluster repair di-iron protein n=1 Tax=Hymenobacter koreensis TaxID=1084523 RepID=A0ABP8J2E4_9BACT